MGFFNRLTKGERTLLIGCLLLALFCFYFLFEDDFSFDSAFSSAPEIGHVVSRENDARHRSKDNLVWYAAKNAQTVRVGDAIFAGNRSSAQVSLKKGGEVTVGENSLVIFSEINNEKVANLSDGNFRLKINGEVRVAVNGQLTTLNGKNSDIQLVVKENRAPQFRVLKGSAQVKRAGKPPVQIDTRKLAAVEEEKPAPAPPPPPPPVQKPVAPTGLTHDPVVNYTWHLEEFYLQNGIDLTEHKSLPPLLKAPTTLEWATQGSTKPATVEYSKFSDFRDATKLDSATGSVLIPLVYLGENYWHVSYDNQTWSITERFVAEPQYLKDGIPFAQISEPELPLIGPKALAKVTLSSSVKAAGYVVSASTSENFPPDQSSTYWTTKSQFGLPFTERGDYYYRFRTVNEEHEISDWSQVAKVHVFRPAALGVPKLGSSKLKGFVDENFPLNFTSQGGDTKVEILDSKGAKVTELEGNNVNWVPKVPGQYKARAYATDRYGRHTLPSPEAALDVQPKPLSLAEQKRIQEEKQKQKDAEQKQAKAEAGKNLAKLAQTVQHYFNETYKSSVLSVAGMLWEVQSSQQYSNNTPTPITMGLGVRILRWWDHQGFEGSIKAGVIGANPAGGAMDAKDMEARYHYRWSFGGPFNFIREMQASAFGGVEVYRASGDGGQFTEQYNLIKLGGTLEFPLAYRWSTGGELVYGAGFDSSMMYEISGHLHYYLSQAWSMGVGYRLHLFQAGSTSSSAGGVLPYREGYTEGYTEVDYHF
jgi:hypothetical protein